MVKVRQDLTGMVFGRLKVLEQAEDHIQPYDVHIGFQSEDYKSEE